MVDDPALDGGAARRSGGRGRAARSPAVYVEAVDGASVTLAANQVAAAGSLLALAVNGVPISLDHGYPARVIVPGEIGVNCLKWVSSMTFAPVVGA